ncbi:MAG: Choline-sulfatase [Acidobacteria bacterium]|nr:Choline-sulfatase [Acidobacteriota bacterium]
MAFTGLDSMMQRAARDSIALGMALAFVLPAVAWKAPASPAVQLLALRADYSGDKPASSAVLAQWTGSGLGAWKRSVVAEGVRFTSPPLGPELGDAARLRIVLRPGGASKVNVLPVLEVKQAKAIQAQMRGINLPLPPAADPLKPVTVESDVKETLRGNWSDEADQPRLQRIEITLPGASPDKGALDEVTFESEAAVYAHAAAGAATVDSGGVLRPSYFVHTGATARVTLDVPQGEPLLRWHDASLGDAGARVVTVIDGGTRTAVVRIEGRAAGWSAQKAPLARWAGRRVTIEMAAEDDRWRILGFPLGWRRDGIGFFGAPRAALPVAAETPDVLVYMIDMLRADRVGAWGATIPGVSPVIDRLAREGVAFRHAISSSDWTKPAIPTLMTGVWETTHRVGAESYTDRLPEAVPVIQERFRNAGWRTGSFVANPLGSTLTGLTRGFDTALPPRYWTGKVGPLGSPSADQLTAAFLPWIGEEPDQPYFAYLHAMEVHRFAEGNYKNPPAGMAPYDASLQDVDAKLGLLLEKLASLPRGRDLLLVVVSDHGHSLGEHGKEGHGISVYQAEVHIPLVFWSKGTLAPRWVEGITGLADVAPTLTDMLQLPPLPEAQGVSLVPLMSGEREQVHDFVPSSLLRFVRFPDAPQQFSVVTPQLEKVIRVAGGATSLYDLKTDPMEQRPRPAGTSPLVGILERWLAEQKSTAMEFRGQYGSAAGPIDAEQVERLRSLGYVQ